MLISGIPILSNFILWIAWLNSDRPRYSSMIHSFLNTVIRRPQIHVIIVRRATTTAANAATQENRRHTGHGRYTHVAAGPFLFLSGALFYTVFHHDEALLEKKE
jgi:hypothetical protein